MRGGVTRSLVDSLDSGRRVTSFQPASPTTGDSCQPASPTEPARQEPSMDRSLQLALAAAHVAEENRGQDVLVLDLRGLTSVFDYFVIASGTSRRQLHAISDEIDKKLCKELRDKRMGIEGYQGSSWILLDYGSVVIHLFETESRDFYAIEKLWGEAPRVVWQSLVERGTAARG